MNMVCIFYAAIKVEQWYAAQECDATMLLWKTKACPKNIFTKQQKA
jgi:hypothetical protein